MKKTRTRRHKPRRNQLLHSLRHEPLEDRRMLATITVNSTDDTVDFGGSQQISDLPGNDGVISLREAIIATNNRPGADVIEFDSGVFASPQTITLSTSSGQLLISDELAVIGPGSDLLTIDGNGSSTNERVLRVDDSNGSTFNTVSISGVTMANGFALNSGGGAIFNSESLTISDSVFTGNEATNHGGGLFNLTNATLDVSSSTIDNNMAGLDGGGIVNYGGMLTVDTSTISSNTADEGGGIYTKPNGITTISNSTIDNNTATMNGGGGVFNRSTGSTHISNSTISGNSATSSGGGGLRNTGAVGNLIVSHSTVTDNTAPSGGALFGTATIDNSILANSVTATSDTESSSAINADFSLIEAPGTVAINGANNLTGSDPQLAAIADNGGPTATHALLAGSPAIDAADPATTFSSSEFDQRGLPFSRVSNGHIDIGAFESQTLSLEVDNASDMVDGDYSDNQLTLREAIELANANPGDDTITFDSSISNWTITLGGTALEITESLMIDASTVTGSVTIDANYSSRVMTFSGMSGDLRLQELTVRNGRLFGANERGGGILMQYASNLTLTDSIVESNFTFGVQGEGGGIRSYDGDVTLIRSVVTGNRASGSSAEGGGIHAGTGQLKLYDSTVSENVSESFGGGILGGVVKIYDSTVSGNEGVWRGGGIFASQEAEVTSSTISANHVSGTYTFGGGGGLLSFGPVNVTSSTIVGNVSEDEGGGIFIPDVTGNHSLTIRNSIVSGNSATIAGPDVRPDPDGTLTINYSLIGDASGTVLASAPLGMPDSYGNLIGDSGNPIDPLLDDLANNGGPTQTHALMPGSPAFNAGDPAFDINDPNGDAIPLDQRGSGFDRVQFGRLDIGAFESETPEPSLFVVTTTNDEVDFSNPDVSLREAITVANAANSADTITFSALFDTSQTIYIDSQLPTITDGLTITGPGADLLTIDAGKGANDMILGDGFRIFDIDDGNTTMIDVEISGLTLTGGDDSGNGGAILNRETLTVSSSTLSGNSANFGGGISNIGGTTTVTNSTLYGNSANYGGGISNFPGTTTVTNSTLSGNSANFGGGGISNIGGTTTVTNSTLYGNSANYGGGIFSNVTTTVTNSIVANSQNGDDLYGAFSGSFNLIEDGANLGDLTNTVTGDPMLVGDLVDNGGPTLTHALMLGSPAFNAGDPNFDIDDPDDDVNTSEAMPFDQRGSGFARVQFGRLDIGAFESETPEPSLFVVTTTNDELDFSNSDVSLREAITVANANPGDDTITFDSSISNWTITLGGTALEITESLMIDASTVTGSVTIGANYSSRVMTFSGMSGDLRLQELTVRNGWLFGANERGGGILMQYASNLTLTDSIVESNFTFGVQGEGGGIRSYDGDVTLIRSVVTGNRASGSSAEGGGIHAGTGQLKLYDSTVSENVSESFGGGILGGVVKIYDSTVSGNEGVWRGGGIFASQEAEVTSSTISANHVSGTYTFGGGGGLLSFGPVNVTSSTIVGNVSEDEGGGIFIPDVTGNHSLTIRNSIVSGNSATIAGPDVRPDPDGTLTINYSLIGDASGTVLASAPLGMPDSYGNLIGDSGNPIDPLLDDLANNGGPTQTHALMPGSPAFNAGDPAFDINDPNGDAIPLDQRGSGFDRVQFGRLDIGAFESETPEPSLFVVTTTNDEVDFSNPDVSLREAITVANAANSADTITFSALFDTSQTIYIDSQLPTITDGLTITGPGADLLTIDAGKGANDMILGDGFRIFDIDDGNTTMIDVEISGLTLTGGDDSGNGGAILNRETLTVSSSTLSGNSANFGGGISNIGGTTTVTNSTLYGNSANYGGGISNFPGTTTVTNSTLSGNSANFGGGGISNIGGTTTVTNSTLYGNSANYGGGIFSNVTTTVTNSIVANSQNGDDLYGAFSGSFNLIEDGANLGDLTNTVTGDPMLVGDLVDNGGPTLTHALMLGSPAFNAGDPNFDIDDPDDDVNTSEAMPFDQRGSGFARVQFGRLDIGAFESETPEPSLFVVTTTNDELDYSNSDVSLREAITVANAANSADTITFSALFDTSQTIYIDSQLPTITDSLTITGPGADLLTIDAGNGTDGMIGTFDGYRHLNIDDGDASDEIVVELSGMTLTGGDIDDVGGAIRNSEDLTLADSTLSGNSANSGGGIYHFRTCVKIQNSTLSGNSANKGGGIYNYSGTATITNSTLSDNSAIGRGGGILNDAGSTKVTNSTLSGNSANEGGGIYNSTGTTTVTNSIVANSQNGGDLRGFGVFSGSFNLIEDGANLGDLTNTVTGDPMLVGDLADNGGSTLTHALMPGSPAFDAGHPDAASGVDGIASTDQRGVPRVLGRLDIGAVESAILNADSDSNWTLRRQASDNSLLEFEFGSQPVVQVLGPLSLLTDLVVSFHGIGDSDDTLTIDYSNGFFSVGAVNFAGNDGDNDELYVIGGTTGLVRAEYLSADAGLGTASVETRLGAQSNTISFSDLKTLDFDELLSFEVDGLLDIGDNTLEVDATITHLDTVTLIDGGTLTVPGGLTLGAGQLLQGHGTVAGPFFGAAGSLINVTGTNGTLTIGDANHFGGFATEGRVTVNNGNTLQLFDRDKAVLGAYTLLDNATLVTGNVVDELDPFEADGPGVLLANGDVIEVTGISIVRTTGDTTLPAFEVDGLVFLLEMGSNLNVFGCLTGSSDFQGDGLLTLNSCGNPGGSSITGTSTFDFLNLTNTNQTIMQLGGLERGTEYDALDVTGLAELDGNLHLGLVDGFQPEVGQQFALIAGPHAGQFSSVTLGPTFDAFDDVGIEIRYDQPGVVLLEIRPPDPVCDFDADGACGASDINRLQAELVSGTGDLTYDLNGDGQVTLADRDEWLAFAGAENLVSGLPYLLADANLDGQVDISDFNVWNSNKFSLTSDWTAGDFNADGQVDISDFNLWNGNKFSLADRAGRSMSLDSRRSLGTPARELTGKSAPPTEVYSRRVSSSDERRERDERESVVDVIFEAFNQ